MALYVYLHLHTPLFVQSGEDADADGKNNHAGVKFDRRPDRAL